MASKAGAASKKGKDTAQETTQGASEATEGATGAAQDATGNGSNGIFSELKDTARDAALEVLKPLVKEAATTAAGYAAKKGPDLIKDKVGDLTDGGNLQDLANDALKQGGPLGKIAGSLGVGGNIVGNILPGGDDDEDGGETDADATGHNRRMPVQQAMDVAVPLSVAYNQWTQFEEYPEFMHRVNSATQDEEGYVTFTEKMWNFTRDFKAEIVEQRPDERIVWRSVNGLQHAGVVTFHELAPRLTHIELTVDFKPAGFFEKIGRGARFSKRAIRADMHRFKAYIEMKEEEDGAWRGFVEDGEVTGYEEEQGEEQYDEDAEGEEQYEDEPEAEEEPDEEASAEDEEEEPAEEEEEEEPEAEEDEEPQAEEEDEEPEAEEEEEPQAEAEEEEPEEKPRKRQQRSRKASSGSNGSGSGKSRSRSQSQSRSKSKAKSGNGGGGRRRPASPRKPKSAKTAAR